MGKSNIVSTLLMLFVVVLIGAATWAVLTYLSAVLGAVVNFASSYESTKLYACGVQAPAEFYGLKADVPVVLPLLYAGFPILLMLIALLSFAAGTYHEDAAERERRNALTQEGDRKGRTRVEEHHIRETVHREDTPEEEDAQEAEEEVEEERNVSRKRTNRR